MLRLLPTVVVALAAAALSQAQVVNIREITNPVNITVPASAYNLATGAASVTSLTAITARIRSNLNWNFMVRAATSTFTHSPSPGAPVTSKPVSNLLIRQNGAGSFIPLSTSNAVVASGASGASNYR